MQLHKSVKIDKQLKRFYHLCWENMGKYFLLFNWPWVVTMGNYCEISYLNSHFTNFDLKLLFGIIWWFKNSRLKSKFKTLGWI